MTRQEFLDSFAGKGWPIVRTRGIEIPTPPRPDRNDGHLIALGIIASNEDKPRFFDLLQINNV